MITNDNVATILIQEWLKDNISRIEFIWDERESVHYWVFNFSIQDNGKTIKIKYDKKISRI